LAKKETQNKISTWNQMEFVVIWGRQLISFLFKEKIDWKLDFLEIWKKRVEYEWKSTRISWYLDSFQNEWFAWLHK
jgi:hypothetical protein